MRLPQPEGTIKYDVSSSDTLSSISLRYNTTPSELTRLNKLSSTLLWPGQTLFIPDKSEKNERIQSTAQTITSPPTALSILSSPRDLSLSPDASLERLLLDNASGDDISRKYLRIKSKYITDGQGVVSGVVLVTKQTLMFNPNVSDHLVVDRGREAYSLRLPLKAISKLYFYKDIAAMVSGDVNLRHKPQSYHCIGSPPATPKHHSSLPGVGIVCRHQQQQVVDNDSSLNESTEEDLRRLRAHLENLNIQQIDTTLSHSQCMSTVECSTSSTTEERSSAVLDMCDRTKTQIDDASLTQQQLPSTAMSDSIMMEESNSASTPKHKPNNFSPSDTNIKTCENENPVETDNSVDNTDAPVNKPQTEVIELNSMSETTDIISPLVHSEPPLAHSESGPLAHSEAHLSPDKHKDVSKDSGFSDQHHGDDNKHSPLIAQSSLSEEAKEWLDKRGIKMPSCPPPENNKSPESTPFHEIEPQEPTAYEDPMMYVAIKVHKADWCPNRSKYNRVMGVPPNRDLKMRQHWFAIPKERVDQLYEFVTHWAPNISSGMSTPCSLGELSTPTPTTEENSGDQGLQFTERFGRTPPTVTTRQALTVAKKVAQDVNRSGSVNSLVSLSSTRSEIDETPDLLSEPNLLTRSQMHTLAKKLPSRTVGHAWELAYSTMVHGISLATLYRNFTDYEGPTLLIVKDEHEKLFGAFLSEPPKVSDGFYGNGESMLYSFKQNHIKVYHWSGTNNFFVKGSKTSLAIGGGNGIFGIWLDEDLYRGRSHSCRTFDNTTLSEHEDFVCTGLEAWTFV